MRYDVRTVAVGLICLCALGCASQREFVSGGEPGQRPTEDLSYFHARAYDLLDIPVLRGGFAPFGPIIPIAHVDAEAGAFVHFGAGLGFGKTWGLGGAPRPQIFETVFGFPFSNCNRACLKEYGLQYGLVFHEHYVMDLEEEKYRGHRCCLFPLLLTLKEREDGKVRFGPDIPPVIRWGDVEVGATVLYFSCRAGISLGELADSLIGWFGLDLAGDNNVPWRERRWSEDRKESPLFID